MTSQRRWYHDDSLHLWLIIYAIWIVLNLGIDARRERDNAFQEPVQPLIEQIEPLQPMPDSSVFLIHL